MSESTIKAARDVEREKAWELEIASGDDLQEEFAALLSSSPPDDAYRIFAGGFFEQGYEAAQKVADEQTADLRDRLELAENTLELIFSKAMAFQPDSPAENVILYKWIGEIKTIARAALKELQEATK